MVCEPVSLYGKPAFVVWRVILHANEGYATIECMLKEAEKNNPLVEKMFAVGAQYGYTKSRRHPSVVPFLFGAKGGAELFDLDRTAAALTKACEAVKAVAQKRGTVLFVGSKAEARQALERTARRLNQPFVAGRWIGGSLTNWSEIKKRLARLSELTNARETGEVAKYTKLERLMLEREENDLDLMFGGLRGLEGAPALMVIIDPRHEKIATEEARCMKVPTVAFLNSDCDANLITYPIPGNDASRHSVEMILGELAAAFEAGVASAAPAAPVGVPTAANTTN